MRVDNVHSRVFPADSLEQMGALIDGLAGDDDRFWPRQSWPAMRFDRPLAVGAWGGHGPIRYTRAGYRAGRRVVFAFTSPGGLRAYHEWAARLVAGGCELRRLL